MLIVNMIHNVSASHNKITITQRGNSRDCVELEHLVEDDQCTVMSNGDTAENTTELNEFIEEEVAATDR